MLASKIRTQATTSVASKLNHHRAPLPTHLLRQQARGDVQAGLQCVLLKLLQLDIHLLLQGQVELGGAVVIGCLLLRRQHRTTLLPQRTAGARSGGGRR